MKETGLFCSATFADANYRISSYLQTMASLYIFVTSYTNENTVGYHKSPPKAKGMLKAASIQACKLFCIGHTIRGDGERISQFLQSLHSDHRFDVLRTACWNSHQSGRQLPECKQQIVITDQLSTEIVNRT